MRIPSFSRSSGATATRDENNDGRIDERDTTARSVQSRPTNDDRSPTARRAGALTEPTDHADRIAAERAADRRDATTTELKPPAPPAPGRATPPAPVEHTGPRPRASIMATTGLVLGVAAAGFVLTGLLAGYGIALGAVALLVSIGGFMATRRRHVAGKSDAMFGLILGLGAIVVGILVVTDSVAWLGTNTDAVGQFREWLDAQFVDRF